MSPRESFRESLPRRWVIEEDSIQEAVQNVEPRFKASNTVLPSTTSVRCFYLVHRTESVTYEVVNNSLREFVRTEAKIGAMELMKSPLER